MVDRRRGTRPALRIVLPEHQGECADLDKYFETLPEALRNAIGTGSISSPVGYLRSEIFSTMGPLLLLILAIGAGARATAGEEEGKTLDLLLANPVTRRTVVLQKFWAMVGSTAGVGLVLVVAIAVFGPAFGLHVALDPRRRRIRVGDRAGGELRFDRARDRVLARPSCRRDRDGDVRGGRRLPPEHPRAERPGADPVPGPSPFYLYIDHDPLRNGFSVPHLLVLIAISAVALTLAVVAFDRRELAS